MYCAPRPSPPLRPSPVPALAVPLGWPQLSAPWDLWPVLTPVTAILVWYTLGPHPLIHACSNSSHPARTVLAWHTSRTTQPVPPPAPVILPGQPQCGTTQDIPAGTHSSSRQPAKASKHTQSTHATCLQDRHMGQSTHGTCVLYM